MVTGTNKQENVSHEILSQNLRSVNIQDLWAHDRRLVSNTGSRGLAYCSSPLGPGRGGTAVSASSIEDCTRGANEVEVIVEGTTPSMTGARETGGCGRGSFLAVYHGLDWNDSLAMLNWRLQEAYTERGQSTTASTGATASSSILPPAMASDFLEAISEETIEEEAIEMEAISPLELESCYSNPSSDSLSDNDGDLEGIDPQKISVPFPPPENRASEYAPSVPPPENIYHCLGWTGRLKVLNQSLGKAYENDTGNPNSPTNTARPQISFYAEDPPVLPHSFLHGLPLFIPDPSSPPNPTIQPSLHYQQEVYPTREPNWGPYPCFPHQRPQVPHHLFCPSAAHAATCGGIFVDPRAVAAIDHVVYNSAMMMFENFRRQFLAMEGKPNVGWRPVCGGELDTAGATPTSTPGVNDPVAFGYTPGEGRASREIDKEPHEEIHEEVNKEMEVGNKVEARPAAPIGNTTTNSIDAQSIIARPAMQDSSTQTSTEAVQDRLGITETLNASSQTEVIEITSTRNFGVQTDVPKIIPRNKAVGSSTQTAPTKAGSIDTSTNAESLPAGVHPAPETQPQSPSTKKRKHRRKKKARSNTFEIANSPPPPPPPPPPQQPPPPPSPSCLRFSTAPCGSLGIPEQTITPIAMDKVKKVSPTPTRTYTQMQHTNLHRHC